MRIYVRIKPKAKQPKVERIDDSHFSVSVTAPPVDGKANEAMIKALADFFDIAKSRIILVAGEKGKDKILEVYY